MIERLRRIVNTGSDFGNTDVGVTVPSTPLYHSIALGFRTENSKKTGCDIIDRGHMDDDRERWDKKWAQMGAEHLTPAPLLVRYADRLGGGRALDLACGVGRNALWLAANGYTVDAVDISPVGLALGRAEAEQRGLTVNFFKADLDDHILPVATYDLIAVFRFLNRRLLPAIGAALRPGGWLFYESLDLRYLDLQPDAPRDYLLTPGELEIAFAHLRVIEAGPNPGRQTSFLVAQAGGQPPLER